MSTQRFILDHLTLDQFVGHGLSLGAIVATLVGKLPALAALAAFIWYVIQIWETKSVKGWRDRRREKRAAKRSK